MGTSLTYNQDARGKNKRKPEQQQSESVKKGKKCVQLPSLKLSVVGADVKTELDVPADYDAAGLIDEEYAFADLTIFPSAKLPRCRPVPSRAGNLNPVMMAGTSGENPTPEPTQTREKLYMDDVVCLVAEIVDHQDWIQETWRY